MGAIGFWVGVIVNTSNDTLGGIIRSYHALRIVLLASSSRLDLGVAPFTSYSSSNANFLFSASTLTSSPPQRLIAMMFSIHS